MEFVDVLILLLIGHFLCDYPLQNDYLAINKNPIVDGKGNPIWLWCLFAHSMIHALPVMWVTGKAELSMVMVVTHFAIDGAKSRNYISYLEDQMLHILVVFVIATGYVSMY